MLRRLFLSVSLCLLAAGPAAASPPLLTDDTATPGDRHWEINVAYTLDRRHAESTHQTPLLDINYGVGDSIQLTYDISWVVLDERGDGTLGGVGNSLVEVKWRFLDEKRDGVSVAVTPQYQFNNPTSSADRGIVEEGTVMTLPVEMNKTFGLFQTGGEIGYAVHRHGGNHWIYGVLMGYDARKDLHLVGEIHGIAANDLSKHEVVFNVGGQWDFSERFGILAAAGRSFRSGASGDPNLLLYVGLQTRLGEPATRER